MSRSSSRLVKEPPTAADPAAAPTNTPALRSSKRLRASSVASSAAIEGASTPRKRGRPSVAGPGLGTPSASAGAGTESESGEAGGSSNKGRREDLWDEELDEVLFRGMALLPEMGRRAIYLETDDESFGRNGLLGEYLRRQTGKIRNRTQIASHLAVMRKNNPKDQRLVELCTGHAIPPSAFSSMQWSALLGPDLHPATHAAAKAENDKVKRHREDVVLALRARRGSSVAGSSPAGKGRGRGGRPVRDAGGEDEDEGSEAVEDLDSDSDLTDLDSDPEADPNASAAPVPAAASAARRRARTAAAAPTPSSAFHSRGGGGGGAAPGSGREARGSGASSAAGAGAGASPARRKGPAKRALTGGTPRRRSARASAGAIKSGRDHAEGEEASAAEGEGEGSAMDVEPDEVAPAEDLARVAASASASAADAPPAPRGEHVDDVGVEVGAQEVDEDVRVGAGFLSGVKKGLWRLVGY